MFNPFTVEQLAKHWQCSEAKVYDLISSEQLRSFRLGTDSKSIRVRREWVDQFECGEDLPNGEEGEALRRLRRAKMT